MTDQARSNDARDLVDAAEAAGSFTEIHYGSEVVVSYIGDLDLASAPELADRLTELLKLPVDSVTVEMSEVSFMDSSGLKVLNQARNNGEKRGVAFVLASVPRCVQVVLEATNMDGLFELR